MSLGMYVSGAAALLTALDDSGRDVPTHLVAACDFGRCNATIATGGISPGTWDAVDAVAKWYESVGRPWIPRPESVGRKIWRAITTTTQPWRISR